MAEQKPVVRNGAANRPGRGVRRKTWQSQTPDPDNVEEKLDEALQDSFPASDPPQAAQPGVTGWDAEDADAKKAAGKR